jgi:STE24 endopeptidase
MEKEGLSDINPHLAKVILDYSHPTLSQRIAAIEKAQAC